MRWAGGRSAAEVDRDFDDIGADHNAFTTSEMTAFHVHTLPEHFPRALEVLADIMRPAIRPESGRAPAVSPAELRRWLDQGHDDTGREVVLLDTRNAFEVDYGTFAGAVDWRIERFTQFPEAVAQHREQFAGKTVVSFCTGGIRCEKAAIVLRDEGVEAYQLEGGILGYFEKEGGAHWRGDCFVFDEREALSPDLAPRS